MSQDTAYTKSFIVIFCALAVMTVVSFEIGTSSKHEKHHTAEGHPDASGNDLIAPVGQVSTKSGDSNVATVAAAPVTPESIYTGTCAACHSVGVLGAPKFGSAEDWSPRVAKGMDVLLQNAIQGLNGTMPAKGGRADLSDELIKETVQYMVDHAK